MNTMILVASAALAAGLGGFLSGPACALLAGGFAAANVLLVRWLARRRGDGV